MFTVTCEHLRDEEDERAEPVEHVVHVGARERSPAHHTTIVQAVLRIRKLYFI
jgi:hypothetical protein